MPSGLHGQDLNRLSEFKSRPLRFLWSGNPGNLVDNLTSVIDFPPKIQAKVGLNMLENAAGNAKSRLLV
jgi:hypothetical protein